MLRDEDMRQISLETRSSTLAAAYTIYYELCSNNKKAISPREFYEKFRDNWEIFANMENDFQNMDCK